MKKPPKDAAIGFQLPDGSISYMTQKEFADILTPEIDAEIIKRLKEFQQKKDKLS